MQAIGSVLDMTVAQAAAVPQQHKVGCAAAGRPAKPHAMMSNGVWAGRQQTPEARAEAALEVQRYALDAAVSLHAFAAASPVAKAAMTAAQLPARCARLYDVRRRRGSL